MKGTKRTGKKEMTKREKRRAREGGETRRGKNDERTGDELSEDSVEKSPLENGGTEFDRHRENGGERGGGSGIVSVRGKERKGYN